MDDKKLYRVFPRNLANEYRYQLLTEQEASDINNNINSSADAIDMSNKAKLKAIKDEIVDSVEPNQMSPSMDNYRMNLSDERQEALEAAYQNYVDEFNVELDEKREEFKDEYDEYVKGCADEGIEPDSIEKWMEDEKDVAAEPLELAEWSMYEYELPEGQDDKYVSVDENVWDFIEKYENEAAGKQEREPLADILARAEKKAEEHNRASQEKSKDEFER